MDKSNSNSKIISASEVGQYTYCPISWYLQRVGYRPDSKMLDIGKKAHEIYGNNIDSIEVIQRHSHKFVSFGLLLLILSIILFIMEAFL